jgi:hypothetical protein
MNKYMLNKREYLPPNENYLDLDKIVWKLDSCKITSAPEVLVANHKNCCMAI